MKQKLLSAILAILFPVSAFCADYDAFTAEVCGTEMSFLVLSETDKTCVAYNKQNQNACINQSYTGEIIIPSEVNGYTVIEIGYNAFNHCLGVTSVTIPNTVTTISYYAFLGCSGLTSIHIPSSIKSIGKKAFEGCNALSSVNITDLAAWCNIQFETNEYDNMSPLPWAYHLYLNGEEVKELSIPNTVTSISAHAFESCASITSVDIPSSVTSIGEKAFALTHLTSVPIPSQITSYKGAFAGCTLLTSVEISDGITLIDEGAFNGCTHLTSIEIPNSVTTIGRIAFGESGLTSITLPTSVTTIEFGAFAKCNGLTSITLPANVTSIGEAAFYQCSALTSVISQIQEPFAFGNMAFTNISDSCILYVPKGTRDAYIAAGWTEEVFKGGIVEVEEGEEVWSAEFPETASSIIPEDITKNAWGTGTYTYTQFMKGNDNGKYILRRYSLTNPNKVQFCVYDWGPFGDDNVNLIIDADYSKYDPATGYVPLSVAPQSIGYYSSLYAEEVMVADSYLYTNTIQGEECSPEDYPSYFDEKNGRFVLNLAYYISSGEFGRGEEYFQLDGYEPTVEYMYQQKEDDGTYTRKYGILTGEHVTEVKYALVKGYFEQDSPEAADIYDKILRNDVDDFVAYGVITGKEAKQVNLNVSEDDTYSFFYTYSNDGVTSHFKKESSFGGIGDNWVDRYVGTYTYKYLFCDYENPDDKDTWIPVEQEGMILQQNTKFPTQWRIKNWGNGTFFDFRHNDDGTLSVYKQPIDNIGDVEGWPNGYSFVASRNNTNSAYDAATGTYSFDLIYGLRVIGTSASTFWSYTVSSYDRGYETFVITDLVPLEEDETVNIADEINEETNLDGNVVGDIFYNISSGNGSYDIANGCIVVTQPTEDNAMEGKDIFGEDFKAGFTGIVFKIPAGKGTVKVQAETTGNMVLKVKIGDNDPIEMELEGKLKVSFPYNVAQDTYVYIYGGTNTSSVKGMHKAPADGELKIYGVELKRDQTPTDIEVVTIADKTDEGTAIYNLSGQHLTTPQKGINIVRTPKGTTQKVFIK